MRCDPIFALVVGVVLLWLVVLSRWHYRGAKATPVVTKPPRAKREPKPVAGCIHKPACPLCKPEAELPPSVSTPPAPPARMLFTQGRHRHVETSGYFCLQASCVYHGRVGWGNIRANGHPNGRRWRQLVCLGCKRHFLETHGTPLHGKQEEPDKLVWASAGGGAGYGCHQTLAAADASDGSRADGPGVACARRAPVSRSSVAPNPGEVSAWL